MSDDSKIEAKRSRLARSRSTPAAPVESIFTTPPPAPAAAEAQAIWNVQLPKSLVLSVKAALLKETEERGQRFTAREATIEALEAWLATKSA